MTRLPTLFARLALPAACAALALGPAALGQSTCPADAPPATRPAAGEGAAVGTMLFDTTFSLDGWAAAKGDFGGDVEKWSANEHRGDEFVNNDGGAGATLTRDLVVPAGEPVAVAVAHGWRNGQGGGSAEVALLDGSGAGVVLVAHQAGGPAKYELFRQSAGGSRAPLAALADDSFGAPSQPGFAVVAAVARLGFDPATGRATASVDGGPSQAVDAGLPGDFAPSRVALTDTSPGDEQLRLTSAHAYAGGLDPAVAFDGVSMPFGGCFAEGAMVDAAVSFGWNGGGSRDVALDLDLIDESGELTVPLGKLSADYSAAPGDRHPLDPSAATGKPLAPGLYRLRGTATVASPSGPVVKPVEARFAVLSKELADRSADVPEYVGMVPGLYPRFDRSQWPGAFDFMRQIGVRHVRLMGGWGRFEPQEGVFDWSENDLFVGLATDHGMGMMMCLSYFGADWATERTGGELARTPEGRALWVSNFAVPMFERYGDVIKDWQIWNEPDAFWNDDPAKAYGFARAFATPQNYYDLLTRTWEAKERVDPSLRVMASLSSGKVPAMMELLFSYGLADHFDGIVVHTYGNHFKHLQNVRRITAEHGVAGRPILVGETGIPTPAAPAAERRQAGKVAGIYLSTATVPNVRGVDYFTLSNKVAEGTFGIADARNQPRPAAVAYFTVAHLLAGATGGEVGEQGTLTTYRIDRAGRPPLLAMVATDGSARSVGLRPRGDSAGAASVPAWDLMGRRTDAPVADGVATVEVGESFVLVEADAAIEPSARLVVDPAWVVDPKHPRGAPQLSVTIDGGPKPGTLIEVAATMTPAAGNASGDTSGDTSGDAAGVKPVELPTREWQVQPGANRVMFAAPDAVPGALYDVRAEVTPKAGGPAVAATRTLEFTPARKVTPEQADGLRRPDGVAVVALGPGDFTALRGGTYAGADDCSAEVAFGYTSDDLVIWVAETDDVFVPVKMPNPWGYDGPQIAIDPRHERSPSATSLEINGGLSAEGPIAHVKDQPHFTADLAAERDEANHKTYYRFKIPTAQLQIAAQPGTAVGLSMILNDNDGDGREGWLGYGRGIGAEKNPALYREILLAR